MLSVRFVGGLLTLSVAYIIWCGMLAIFVLAVRLTCVRLSATVHSPLYVSSVPWVGRFLRRVVPDPHVALYRGIWSPLTFSVLKRDFDRDPAAAVMFLSDCLNITTHAYICGQPISFPAHQCDFCALGQPPAPPLPTPHLAVVTSNGVVTSSNHIDEQSSTSKFLAFSQEILTRLSDRHEAVSSVAASSNRHDLCATSTAVSDAETAAREAVAVGVTYLCAADRLLWAGVVEGVPKQWHEVVAAEVARWVDTLGVMLERSGGGGCCRVVDAVTRVLQQHVLRARRCRSAADGRWVTDEEGGGFDITCGDGDGVSPALRRRGVGGGKGSGGALAEASAVGDEQFVEISVLRQLHSNTVFGGELRVCGECSCVKSVTWEVVERCIVDASAMMRAGLYTMRVARVVRKGKLLKWKPYRA